jgi:MFS transporter, DHA2 family, methylenomycin A resistance protein
VITHAFPEPAERARAIGMWAGIGSVALPAGPLLGGALVQGIGWRAVFFINVPIVLVAFAVAARVVQGSTEAQQRRLDIPGMLLGAALLAVVTFALIEAGHAGTGPAVVGGLVVAAVLLGGFWLVERRAADPMLEPGLFRHGDFSASNAVAGTMNLVTLGLIFLLTLYLQRVQGRSALAAGVAVLPLFVPLAVLAPLAGRLTARVGARRPMAIGCVLAAIGVAQLALAQPNSGYLTMLPALLSWGIGLGILTPAVVAAAIGALSPDRAGLASAVNNTARQAGGAIGIAAFGALAGRHFMSGFHTAALIGAAGFVAAAVATLRLIPPGQNT